MKKDTSDGDAIKVFVRVRPPCERLNSEGACLEVDRSRNAIVMWSKPEQKVFRYDCVCDFDITQEAMFSNVGKQVIESCIAGYNGTIFAYGQTGSGKTFTMLGPAEDSENFHHILRGVIPRSFEQLFNHITEQKQMHGEMVQFLCRCSFLEIYHDQLYDLLDPSATGPLQLRENLKRGIFVEGLVEQAVTSAADAYHVLSTGWINRTVASTSMNRESSRSHAVFMIHIESKENKGGVWHVKSSQLNLVDLAGSERQKDTHAVGIRLKEARSINKSLSALGNVIMALGDVAQGKTRHVPYRDSKLSFLLRDSLGGNAKTSIIACVHPGAKCFGETLSTLQFASRAKLIKNKALVNEDAFGSLEQMQVEIRRLKEALMNCQNGNGGSSMMRQIHDESGVVEEVFQQGQTDWRECFLQAMYFRQQMEEDSLALEQRLQRLQTTCNRKEQALRQSRMVLKFREDGLKKLEKAAKAAQPLGDDDKDEIIACLRGEVSTLQKLVENHPGVTEYQLLSETLRSELTAARAQTGVAGIDAQRAAELEELYLRLKEESNTDVAIGRRLSIAASPKQAVEAAVVSMPTLDHHKAQISELQSEVDKLRSELTEERQSRDRESRERNAQVAALKRGREELEKVLKAHQLHMQVERRAREDRHMDTIKTITTPKRAKYMLRNRVVMAPASGVSAPSAMDVAPGDGSSPAVEAAAPPQLNLNLSFGDEASETITGESAPPGWMDETVEALTEEISKLQEENCYLHTQHETKENELIRLVEQLSAVESQKASLQQLYDEEHAQSLVKGDELQKKVNELSNELKEKEFAREVLQGEVRDLWVMIGAQDKKMQENRKDGESYKANAEIQMENLRAKNMKLEVELSRVEKEISSTLKNLDTVKESEENLQATLDFTHQQLQEKEESNAALDSQLKQVQAELKSVTALLTQEEEKGQHLAARLAKEGDMERQLLNSLNNVKSQQAAASEANSRADAMAVKLELVESELASCRVEIERLAREHNEKKEAINSLSRTVCDQKEALLAKQQAAECLASQLDEATARGAALVAACETAEQKADLLEKRLGQVTLEHQDEIQKRTAELEMAQEDYQDQLDYNSKTMDELNKANQTNAELSEEIECLKEKLSVLETQLVEQRAVDQTDSLRTQLDNETMKMAEVMFAFGHISTQLEEAKTAGEQQQMELDSLRKTCDTSEARCQQLLAEKNAANEQLEVLKTAQAEREAAEKRNEDVAEKNAELQKRLTEVNQLCQKLDADNKQLAGHQNLKQKIHYYSTLKDANSQLSEKLCQVTNELTRYKLQYDKPVQSVVKQTLHATAAVNGKDVPPPPPRSEGKENAKPTQ